MRFETYNTAFSDPGDDESQCLTELGAGDHEPMQDIAQIIQRKWPDVPQVGEFDCVGHIEGVEICAAADAFGENYPEVAQGDEEPIEYQHAFVAPSNTGADSGFDLNRDGDTGTPAHQSRGVTPGMTPAQPRCSVPGHDRDRPLGPGGPGLSRSAVPCGLLRRVDRLGGRGRRRRLGAAAQ